MRMVAIVYLHWTCWFMMKYFQQTRILQSAMVIHYIGMVVFILNQVFTPLLWNLALQIAIVSLPWIWLYCQKSQRRQSIWQYLIIRPIHGLLMVWHMVQQVYILLHCQVQNMVVIVLWTWIWQYCLQFYNMSIRLLKTLCAMVLDMRIILLKNNILSLLWLPLLKLGRILYM